MEFYIVNDLDRPDAQHVAQIINEDFPIELEYLHPDLRDWGKLRYQNQSTNVEHFGFTIDIEENQATFRKIRESVAVYKDGLLRSWQGASEFTLQIKPIGD